MKVPKALRRTVHDLVVRKLPIHARVLQEAAKVSAASIFKNKAKVFCPAVPAGPEHEDEVGMAQRGHQFDLVSKPFHLVIHAACDGGEHLDRNSLPCTVDGGRG